MPDDILKDAISISIQELNQCDNLEKNGEPIIHVVLPSIVKVILNLPLIFSRDLRRPSHIIYHAQVKNIFGE